MTESKNLTITDIAKAAGVSKTTVSRYINGRYELMSSDTRARIQAVIDMSGYRPSSIAQSLRARQSRQIGVVIADIANPFSSSLIRGIGHVLQEENYVPLIVDSKSNADQEKKLIEGLMSRRVDGLIVNASSRHNPDLIQLALSGLPIVLCDRRIDHYRFTFVGSELKRPILEVVAHMRNEGFSTVAFFTPDFQNNSARSARHNAYLQAMAACYPHIPAEAMCKIIDPDNPEITRNMIRELIESAPAGRPPAIICVNTMTVVHVLAVIRQMHLQIPEDIGLCGPDDWGADRRIDWLALAGIGITTFAMHPYLVGSTAAQALLGLIRGEIEPGYEQFISSELVLRESTGIRGK